MPLLGFVCGFSLDVNKAANVRHRCCHVKYRGESQTPATSPYPAHKLSRSKLTLAPTNALVLTDLHAFRAVTRKLSRNGVLGCLESALLSTRSYNGQPVP